MKTKKGLIFGLILLGMTFLVWSAKAQTSQSSSEEIITEDSAATSSLVDIINQEVSNIDNGKVIISFDLVAKKSALSGIKYSVTLENSNEKGTQVFDEKIANEKFDLAANEQKSIKMTYELPKYLKGEYQIWINVNSENGDPLTLAIASKSITLNGSNEYLEPNYSKIYLTIKEDLNTKQYGAKFGVDVDKNENLIFNGEFTNRFKKEMVVYPQFTTYFRSVFGNIINVQKADQAISFKAGEKKLLQVAVPKVEKPQAYEVRVDLVDANGQNVSFPINFHYVLRGDSATIQSISLDKDYYQKGEKANLSLELTGQANAFDGSRKGIIKGAGNYLIEASIKDSKGNYCSKKSAREITQEESLQFSETASLSITADCLNPEATVQIKNAGGEVLDTQTFKVVSKNIKEGFVKNTLADDFERAVNGTLMKILGVLAILFIICIGMIIYKKIKSSSGSVITIFFMFIAASLLFSYADKAGAAATSDWKWEVPKEITSYYDIDVSGFVGLDNFVYERSEPMDVYTQIKIIQSICRNSGGNVDVDILFGIEKRVDGKWVSYSEDKLLTSESVKQQESDYGNDKKTFSMAAPKEEGSYRAKFTINLSAKRDWKDGEYCYHCGVKSDSVTPCHFENDNPGYSIFGNAMYWCSRLDEENYPEDTNETCGCPGFNEKEQLVREISFSVFDKNQRNLGVAVIGTGKGTIKAKKGSGGIWCSNYESAYEPTKNCKTSYSVGAEVLLDAIAFDENSEFLGWGGSCSGTSPTCKLTMNGDLAVTAKFNLKDKEGYHKLITSFSGNGNGNITSIPAGINCVKDGPSNASISGTCAYLFEENSQVTLNGAADSGSIFNGWSGSDCSGILPCTFNMDADKTVIANVVVTAGCTVGHRFNYQDTAVCQPTDCGVTRNNDKICEEKGCNPGDDWIKIGKDTNPKCLGSLEPQGSGNPTKTCNNGCTASPVNGPSKWIEVSP